MYIILTFPKRKYSRYWKQCALSGFLLVKIVESVTVLVGHGDVHLFTHGNNILVADPAERLGVLLECEVGGLPLLEQRGQHVRRLAADHEQSRVQLAQAGVKILQALQQEPGQHKASQW